MEQATLFWFTAIGALAAVGCFIYQALGYHRGVAMQPRGKRGPAPPRSPYGIMLFLVALTWAAVAVNYYYWGRHREIVPSSIEPLTFDDLRQTYIHDRSVYVSDLARAARDELEVEGKVFENVTFVGPAMVTFLGYGTLVGSTFDLKGGRVEALFLEVPEGTLMIGAIGFKNCTFRNCRFVRIQVVGPKALIDRIRDGIKLIQ